MPGQLSDDGYSLLTQQSALFDGGFLSVIRDALPASMFITSETLDTASGAKGAYALAIAIGAPVALSYKGRPCVLQSGHYLYAGSAYGPGGIGARLRHHFRRDKKPHWHVDRLTSVAERIVAFAIEGGTECEIVARLSGVAGFSHPLDGFGSSDCATCQSHLLAYARVPRTPLGHDNRRA